MCLLSIPWVTCSTGSGAGNMWAKRWGSTRPFLIAMPLVFKHQMLGQTLQSAVIDNAHHQLTIHVLFYVCMWALLCYWPYNFHRYMQKYMTTGLNLSWHGPPGKKHASRLAANRRFCKSAHHETISCQMLMRWLPEGNELDSPEFALSPGTNRCRQTAAASWTQVTFSKNK